MRLNFAAVLLMAVITISAGCKGQHMEKKYNWTGTVSAPEEYPVEVYEGALIAPDFTYSFDAIWGTQNTGWGNAGGIMSVETEAMEAPDSLKFTWLSHVEKKFYTGSWALDRGRIEKLFNDGFTNSLTGKKETYSLIKVGLAPGGRVVVWLSGTGFQTEVGTFTAKETSITPETAYESAKYMFNAGFSDRTLADDSIMKPEIVARIKEDGRPEPRDYDHYREKYKWRVSFQAASNVRPDEIFVSYLNGEEETLSGAAVSANVYAARAVPRYLILIWQDADGKKSAVRIDPFDLKETPEAFSKLGTGAEIDLVVTLNDQKNAARVILKNESQQITLQRAKSRITQIAD
ncbi:DUF2931 family protein [Pedobacter sp. SYP-B3415]|uniref:DUF2931 family protein n=1 Tax=Pedobacter sp. SYP-B3415 TaxID=2496641 RepID=UPI00101DF125|nr:DUF2931 family protein [Pedobacter sp. SYP-B3415]